MAEDSNYVRSIFFICFNVYFLLWLERSNFYFELLEARQRAEWRMLD